MIIRLIGDTELILGVLFAGTFLLLHRPGRWLSAASLSLTGWPVIIFLLFARSIVITTLDHLWLTPIPQGGQEVWVPLASLGAIVALLGFMVVTFLRFRYRDRHPAPKDTP